MMKIVLYSASAIVLFFVSIVTADLPVSQTNCLQPGISWEYVDYDMGSSGAGAGGLRLIRKITIESIVKNDHSILIKTSETFKGGLGSFQFSGKISEEDSIKNDIDTVWYQTYVYDEDSNTCLRLDTSSLVFKYEGGMPHTYKGFLPQSYLYPDSSLYLLHIDNGYYSHYSYSVPYPNVQYSHNLSRYQIGLMYSINGRGDRMGAYEKGLRLISYCDSVFDWDRFDQQFDSIMTSAKQ